MKKVFKILFVGDVSVGKTTLINRYIGEIYHESTPLTVGVDFYAKELLIGGDIYHLQIWDVAGQERFRFFISDYLKGIKGAILLFDITNMISFVNIEKWVQIIRSVDKDIPILLVAAKCDLEEYSLVGDHLAKSKVKQFNLIDCVKVSSRLGINIDLPFERLLQQISVRC